MPGTMLETIRAAVEEAVETQVEFVKNCRIEYDDINARSSELVFVGWNKWRWAPLADEAQGPLGEARAATSRARRLVSLAVQASEKGRLSKAESTLDFLDGILDQSYGMWGGAPGKSIEEVIEELKKRGDDLMRVVETLPSARGRGGRLLVPDANALVWAPDLSAWRVDVVTTMVIVPQITRELDELKMREKPVAAKAQKVINQFNEFDRRGDTSVGVSVAGKLKLREVATYPDFALVPEFLDQDLADDRVLASALELAWVDLNAEVLVATRDRNMKNRARLVGLGSVDVAELTGLGALA